MSLFDTIFEAQKNAMKARDTETLSTLRMLTAAIKNVEIESSDPLTDEQVMDVVRRQVKQLRDARKDFETGGRADLVAQSDREIGVLSVYLPTQLSEDEIRTRLVALFEGKSGLQIGPATGMAMKELKDSAEGTLVRSIVSELLTQE